MSSTRHAVMCIEQGNVLSDGLLLRTGEQEFSSYFLNPYLNYFVDSGRYNVLPFFKHRPSRIVSRGEENIAVRVLRVGVAGTLAYEVHGR